MVELNRNRLRKTKSFEIEKLRSEKIRKFYLEGHYDDPEFTDEHIRQAELIVELSREYHGHPEPVDNVTDLPRTDKGNIGGPTGAFA